MTQVLKFEVETHEANLILQGLGELPARVSMNLIAKLQSQAQSQLEQKKEGEQHVG